MMRRRLLLSALCGVALVAMSGCGPSYIILEISADLAIPTEANSLHVVTLDPDDLNRVLANVDFLLVEGDAFPLDVLLEPSDGTPKRLRHRVTARLDGVAVAYSEVEHPWDPHHASHAAFSLQTIR
ncbi:MAG: hypothetical protein V3T05_02405 [Myxococcota bacterium]